MQIKTNNKIFYNMTDNSSSSNKRFWCGVLFLTYILVAVEHIAVNLSEIFNLFSSSLDSLILYSKNLYSLQDTNVFSWKCHKRWFFFPLSSTQLHNSYYTEFQLIQEASLQRLVDAQSLLLIFYEQADSLLVVCCLFFVLFLQFLNGEGTAMLCWTLWISSEIVFCD